MAQEPLYPGISSSSDDDDPTEPRIAVPLRTRKPVTPLVAVRQQGNFRLSIDEQGVVSVAVPGQALLVLQPDEAFELLDFLFASRNLLAARSAERAETEHLSPSKESPR